MAENLDVKKVKPSEAITFGGFLFIQKQLSIAEKLSLLSRGSQHDFACVCATSKNEHRKKSKAGGWIYPVTLLPG
ncbi:MAG: hypothetical protein KKH08_06205 [Candidatus Omnitrophica bacterium]|nr:hypothetical protein [Candidatus Omnitrophota bacterium]